MSKLTSPIVVIDCETTGLVPFRNEVIEICMLPLHMDFSVNEDVPPLKVQVRPENWDHVEDGALKVNGWTREALKDLPERKESIAQLNAYWDKYVSVAAFKQLHVLAHNAAFDKGFVHAWLDPTRKHENALDLYFHYRWRCSMAAAQFVNDKFQAQGGKPVFHQLSLGGLCRSLDIAHEKAHSAEGDCRATAALYRKLTGRG